MAVACRIVRSNELLSFTLSLCLSPSLSLCRPITIFVVPVVSSQSPRLFIDEKHFARGGKYLTSKRGDQVARGVCSNRRQIQFIIGCWQSSRATRLTPAETENRNRQDSAENSILTKNSRRIKPRTSIFSTFPPIKLSLVSFRR